MESIILNRKLSMIRGTSEERIKEDKKQWQQVKIKYVRSSSCERVASHINNKGFRWVRSSVRRG